MRIFVTGASGFVGSAVVEELLSAGHQVVGMVRSDAAAARLLQAGGEAHMGDLYNLESIRSGAKDCDGVIHTAFNHNFTTFKDNCETDRQVITALAAELKGSQRPLVVTSGIGLLNGLGRVITENDHPEGTSATFPRIATEEAVQDAAKQGVNTYIVRLPPSVHGRGDHGFVPMLIDIARDKRVSAYMEPGNNQWPAVHRFDAAVLYRQIAEQQPAQKVFHAVAEQGIQFRDIATAIGKGLQLTTEGKTKEDAAVHFGWFAHFAAMNCRADASQTKLVTGWQHTQVGLLKDIETGGYFDQR